MRLVQAHRILIRTFVALALVFAATQYRRWRATDDSAALATVVGSLVVAVGCVIYLARARHLRPRG